MGEGLGELEVGDPELGVEQDGFAGEADGGGEVAGGEGDLGGEGAVHGAQGVELAGTLDGRQGLSMAAAVREQDAEHAVGEGVVGIGGDGFAEG